MANNANVTCSTPRCVYYLTYGCACQKPKCRANNPAFQSGGLNCPQHKVRAN